MNEIDLRDINNVLAKSGFITVSGPIDAETADRTIKLMLYLSAMNPELPIQLYINSPGGEVSSGLAIVDTMRHIPNEVSTICVGMAASMGALILSAGTKGKRYALENAEIMIHQPLGGGVGQASDVELAARHIIKVKEKLNRMLAENCGQDYETICSVTDRDNWMDAEEALEFGIIDGIM